MTKRCRSREEKNLLPFHIIKAASEGDVLAINKVLKHYEGYIITLSTRKMYERPLKNILFFRFKFQIHTKNPPVSIILVDFL